MNKIKLGNRYIGEGEPVYIIADIGSNFDGQLDRALKLIDLAKECGCDCAKFQSFLPDRIINKKSFEKKTSFQSNWDKSVYDTYKDASLPREWHKELSERCKEINIDFMSTPYDYEAVDLLDELNVPAFKIGSGEITNLSFLEYVGSKKRPIILGTGASNMKEIADAVAAIQYSNNYDIILLQCITQYPTPIEYANIKAMVTLSKAFDCPVGYSDHSRGNIVALGAVALGACVIEKHFTDDNLRNGPDHPHSMNLRQMDSLVHDVKELEKALGSPIKQVEECEKETRIIQRRSLFTVMKWYKGSGITESMVKVLRPATGLEPKYLKQIEGLKAKEDIEECEPITWEKLSP
jgi:sialic acid synthase SpsE